MAGARGGIMRVRCSHATTNLVGAAVWHVQKWCCVMHSSSSSDISSLSARVWSPPLPEEGYLLCCLHGTGFFERVYEKKFEPPLQIASSLDPCILTEEFIRGIFILFRLSNNSSRFSSWFICVIGQSRKYPRRKNFPRQGQWITQSNWAAVRHRAKLLYFQMFCFNASSTTNKTTFSSIVLEGRNL